MEFLILLFIGWIFWTLVGAAARQQKQAKELQASQPTQPDWYALAQSESGHVLHAGPAPAAVLPARTTSEESSSELMWDELAGDTELNEPGLQVVSLESITPMSVEARALPDEAVSLEHEVDWEVEHENFHRKYVDGHSSGSAARHGLMDEMRDPGALRRAVLMAEILGPPKSLRR